MGSSHSYKSILRFFFWRAQPKLELGWDGMIEYIVIAASKAVTLSWEFVPQIKLDNFKNKLVK